MIPTPPLSPTASSTLKTIFPIRPPYRPELLHAAKLKVEVFLSDLSRQFSRLPRVLELGAGHSTLWLAEMSDLSSIEHDQDWFDEVGREVRHTCTDAEVWLEYPDRFVHRVESYPDGGFDLIYIDCIDDQRMPCLIASIPKLKLEGMIILDDTHWEILKPAFEILNIAEWTQMSLEGNHLRHSGETKYHHTTFFQRR